MEKSQIPLLSVSDFIATVNQTLDYAYQSVAIEGEVSGFKVNQGKFVFFDLKDASGSVGCFMVLWQLRVPIQDGMKVVVTGIPKLTPWGKFSVTVKSVRPSGEGSLKKSFDILKKKLTDEGVFSDERKRPLPELPKHVGVISSTQAAGYADFIKILGDRWGGMKIDVAHVQVQGASAPDQIISAIKYFNEQEILPEVLVIVRGGGSLDDLSVFNDELLVREIAGSRIPVLTGIGHETDEMLADLAADVRASTPSNAAQLLTPDKREIRSSVDNSIRHVLLRVETVIDTKKESIDQMLANSYRNMSIKLQSVEENIRNIEKVLSALDPSRVLRRGYAIVKGDQIKGGTIIIEKIDTIITAEVKDVEKR